MTASPSSTSPSTLNTLSSTALGKTAWVSADTLSRRCKGGRSEMRFGRTRTAVSGLTSMPRDTSFISQKLGKENAQHAVSLDNLPVKA